MRVLRAVLTMPPNSPPIDGRELWWARYRTATREATSPIERAILGGFAADRLGYAFAAGYEAALSALFPEVGAELLGSMCVTERGGGHPRAIETRLEPAAGGFRVTGQKRWATLCGDAAVLFVAASTGHDADGRNQLRMVRVPAGAPGLALRPMPEPDFVPEIAHEEVELEGVLVDEAALLPGDGFDRYVRPFRTLEDLFVQAAVFAYGIRETRENDFSPRLTERFAGLLVALASLADEDASAPEVHVALAGLISHGAAALDDLARHWRASESPAHGRWERDQPLLSVAGKAREKRALRAWEKLGG